MENQIAIELSDDGTWMARHIGPHKAEILRLFDTDILPTSYGYPCDGYEVVSIIQRLNPGVRVYLA